MLLSDDGASCGQQAIWLHGENSDVAAPAVETPAKLGNRLPTRKTSIQKRKATAPSSLLSRPKAQPVHTTQPPHWEVKATQRVHDPGTHPRQQSELCVSPPRIIEAVVQNQPARRSQSVAAHATAQQKVANTR